MTLHYVVSMYGLFWGSREPKFSSYPVSYYIQVRQVWVYCGGHG